MMETVIELHDLRKLRTKLQEPVGLVPTMGYLHEGHLSLVEQALSDCASVVVSIFVNPSQFGPGEDLEAYPRDLPKDLDLLSSQGVDLVWMPTPEVMYPNGFQTWVNVEEVTQTLEGKRRPGHFRGVSTVVAKLFNGVTPQKAYFGQKDAQQVIVIQQMKRDLNIPVDIVICPIIREPDGLAMSSRNSYLDTAQRKAATVLWHSLNEAKKAFECGEKDAGQLREVMTKKIASEPLARLDYVSVADGQTLVELEQVRGDTLFSMAVYVGRTRLIDNFLLRDGHWMVGERIRKQVK